MDIRSITITLTMALALTSCAVYSPQTADIPLIQRKNDFRFDGGVSLFFPTINTTLSYGVTNKIAAQVYGNRGHDRGEYYYHGALGYYKNLRRNTLLELYGGAGFGSAYYFDGATGESLRGKYVLPFVQINFGKLRTELSKEEFGIGLKTGFIRSDLNLMTYDYGALPYVYDGLLVEPTIFYRYGKKKARMNYKLSSCWLRQLTTDQNFPYSKINVGISLNVR